MVKALLEVTESDVELVPAPFRFSSSMATMGRPGCRKVAALAKAVWGTLRLRRKGATHLYYCVAGAERFPLWRDAAFLVLCRQFFDTTTYHFHAGGASEYLARANPAERWLLRKCIGSPDLGIKLSASSPPDPEYLGARHVAIVPNGVGAESDPMANWPVRTPSSPPGRIRLISVGRVSESKGSVRLVHLVKELRARGIDVSAVLVGDADSQQTVSRINLVIEEFGLSPYIKLAGPAFHEEKWRHLNEADYFVFLTDFEHENVPLVIIEAMMCGIPILATRWRGIPGLLNDGELGALVNLADWPGLVNDVESTFRAPEIATQRAERAREAWRSRHTLKQFQRQMLEELVPGHPAIRQGDPR